jgi:hypothetical protein
MISAVVYLEKSDIVTSRFGDGFEINAPNGVRVAFTKDAAEEFLADLQALMSDPSLCAYPVQDDD